MMDITKYCIICRTSNHTKEIINIQNSDFEILSCSNCGFAYRKIPTDINILELQKNESKAHSLRPKYRYTKWPFRNALVAKSIEKITGNYGKILDIGCSNGAMLASFSKNWDKYGVELCEHTAKVAKDFAKAEIFCGPIENYLAQKESFDLITLFAVIEHLKNPKEMIKWIYDHLKPGGCLAIMTGDRESSVAQIMKKSWPLYHSPDHLSYFSARSLRQLLEQNNFKVLKEEWRFMYPISNSFHQTEKVIERFKEILGFIRKPKYDHYYCYSIKRKN